MIPENFELINFLILSGACFIAAFIDAVAGGGGLISLPAFMASGIPTEIALGTNKLANSFSTIESALKFAKSGKVNWTLIKIMGPFSLLGTIFGVNAVMIIDKKYLTPLVFCFLILVLAYTLMNKNIGNIDEFAGLNKNNTAKGIVAALLLGFYDGFLGPGIGSFLIFTLIKIFKMDFIKSSANAKVLNLFSNIMSVSLFIYYGKVSYFYSLTIGLIMIIGARLGTKMALAKGTGFIKPVFLTATTAVTIKMGFSFFI